MGVRTVRETLKIRTIEELHNSIQYFDHVYGLEEGTVTFPDGLPLASVTYLSQEFEDGTSADQLILSDVSEGEGFLWP
jgi:hypothetical protein